MNLPDMPRSVVLDSDRHVWVRRVATWECVTNREDADRAWPEHLTEFFAPITVIYDAGAELL